MIKEQARAAAATATMHEQLREAMLTQTKTLLAEREAAWKQLTDSVRLVDTAMMNRRMGLHDFPQSADQWLNDLIGHVMAELGVDRDRAIQIVREVNFPRRHDRAE